MRIEYEPKHDIEFLEKVKIVDSLELDGIIVDYSKDKRIVAIEILNASKRTTRKPFEEIDLTIMKG